jgi:hypothetical protein
MTLTSYNGHVAVRCASTKEVARLTAILHADGFGTKVKIIKAKAKRFPRHFILMVYPPHVPAT